MAVVKVIELVGDSRMSWEDAVRSAVKTASKTIRNISGVKIKHFTGNVDEDGNIVEYKVNLELAFKVDGTD